MEWLAVAGALTISVLAVVGLVSVCNKFHGGK